MMKAVVYSEYGSVEVLKFREVPKPTPKANEVLIKIHATTVNRTDVGFRAAEYFAGRIVSGLFRPKQPILGTELSGEIVAVGKDVTRFKVGDQVFGIHTFKFGAHAEYLCASEKKSITVKPANLSFEEAAGVCEGMMLGNNYIRDIDFSKVKKILINGASGSIGIAVLQLARLKGVEITAVGNPRSLELLKSLGADKVLDYTKEDFTRTTEKYDVILDMVGKSSFFKCKKLLTRNGIYYSSELGYLSQNVYLPLLTAIFSRKKVKFPIPTDGKIDVVYYRELIEAGKYKPVIDRVYPFDQILEAYKFVETGEKTGNVVISIC